MNRRQLLKLLGFSAGAAALIQLPEPKQYWSGVTFPPPTADWGKVTHMFSGPWPTLHQGDTFEGTYEYGWDEAGNLKIHSMQALIVYADGHQEWVTLKEDRDSPLPQYSWKAPRSGV